MNLYRAVAWDTWGEYEYEAGIFSSPELAWDALRKNYHWYTLDNLGIAAGARVESFDLDVEIVDDGALR